MQGTMLLECLKLLYRNAIHMQRTYLPSVVLLFKDCGILNAKSPALVKSSSATILPLAASYCVCLL